MFWWRINPRMARARLLWGCLALDAFYLLARDVDGSGEPVGLENPTFDHVLDLPRGETEVLGCLHHGELLAMFVFHATNLLARQRPGSRHPIRIPGTRTLCPYAAERWQVRNPKIGLPLYGVPRMRAIYPILSE
jgi:hypothetical protein